MDLTLIYYIFISLAFSAFFSGIEMAFISSDKLQIELQGSKNTFVAKSLYKFIKNPSKFIGTTLVGNTLALVLYGYLMALLLEPYLYAHLPEIFQNQGTVLLLQTVISTLIVLTTAEFLPKSIFMINPNGMLTVFALPMRLLMFVMTPVTFFMVRLSRFIIVRVMGLEYSDTKPVYKLTDLNNLIKNTLASNDSEKNSVEVDSKIFSNALEFKKIRVRECMIPRTEITAVNIDEDLAELKQAFGESGHSKIVVYKESIDEVVGYCHTLELFKKPQKIADIVTPLMIVPETMLANELMIKLIAERKSLALVVDEYGGTSGIVSIEDIIEEIFGEIQDEHDDEDLTEQQLDEFNYLLSARHEIDYLNEKYEWNLPTGEYETLGGLILSIAEDLPKKGQTIIQSSFAFTIQSVEDIRIETVKLTINHFPSENN
ncbi:MAG: hemolysin family protein [Cyclobacteriaceae bacterium]|nr:hemolysin family protein [Cyclobacteriaceae bacterium]